MRPQTRPLSTSLFFVVVAGLLAANTADAQFIQQWQVGLDNNTNSEFGQEVNGLNPAPGSATAKDDDWYFGGVYDSPIGTLAEDEPLANFERALTRGDSVNRIHFNLPIHLTLEGTEFRLLIDTVSNQQDAPLDPIPFTIQFNGVEVFSGSVDQTTDFFITPSFFVGTGPGQVPATTGDNVVTLSRPTDDGAGWMQFDYVRLETTAVPEPSAALSFAAGSLLLGCLRRRRQRS